MNCFWHFRNIALLVFCCSTAILSAQNLVLNPSFEQTTACPQGISEFNLAVDWAQGNSGAVGCSTSDLYASCVPAIGGSNSPNGLLGYQQSRTGDHHAGIILVESFPGVCTPFGDNYREYIEGKLSAPLVAGQKYIVRFYVSKPEGAIGGTDDFGVYFSNTYYSHNACNDSSLMKVTPQLNYCGDAIIDTFNWVEVKWIYQAVGGEQYLTIGNFKNDAQTTIVPTNCGGSGPFSTFSGQPFVYYYIDDVEVSAAPLNECAFAVSTTSINVSCGTNNGKARVLASGCVSPFTYAWNNGSNKDSTVNLSPGTYQVTVSDVSNCQVTASVTVNSFTPPVVMVNAFNSSCIGNSGSALANIVNPSGVYTYNWSNGSNKEAIDKLAPGTYAVTVTGPGNCSATASGVVDMANGSLQVAGSATPATCGANNGAASVVVTGAPGPFTYAWNTAASTSSISGLAPGTYTVTVSSTNAVSPTVFYTENFNTGGANWTLNLQSDTNSSGANMWIIDAQAECPCDTGSGQYLHITADTGAFNPFPGFPFPFPFPDPRDHDCSYETGIPMNFPGFPSFFPAVSTDKYCSSPDISTVGRTNMVLTFKYKVGGDSTLDYGLVRFSANGGATWLDMPTKYTDSSFTCATANVLIPSAFENISNFRIGFRWKNNSDGEGNDPGFAIDDIKIAAGAGGNCPSVATITVPGGSGLNITASTTDAICGQNNGTATATVAGTGNFTYNWSNGQQTATITGLQAGTYTVTVSGGGNCSSTASTIVVGSAGINLTPSSTDATCGNNNGTATVTPSGTGNFTYQWSSGGTNAATISNLSPGTYTVTVSQQNCSATASINVIASAGLQAVFSNVQPSCGQANGVLNVSGIFGGTQPILMEWRVNGTVISTNSQITNLGGGTYAFHAADASGCTVDTSFTLLPGGVANVAINGPTTPICSGDSAQICAPAGYAAYQWNSGEVTQCIQAQLAGNYIVTITDHGNCTAASNRLAVTFRPLPSISITVNGDTLSAFNATTYQWYKDGVLIQGATSSTYIALESGNYTLRITDANGCSATSQAVSIVTGIGEVTAGRIRVYPNPTAVEGWYIDVTSNLIGSNLEVFDDAGRVVYKMQLNSVISLIDFDAAQGVYMLRLNTANGVITQKLIKL